VSHVDVTSFASCAIEWRWDAATKTWLVQALSLRNGGRRVVAQCHVLRSDPLPDHVLGDLLHSIIDYWQAGQLF
jgi:hypothetical protein